MQIVKIPLHGLRSGFQPYASTFLKRNRQVDEADDRRPDRKEKKIFLKSESLKFLKGTEGIMLNAEPGPSVVCFPGCRTIEIHQIINKYEPAGLKEN